jgi:hypothetical protein
VSIPPFLPLFDDLLLSAPTTAAGPLFAPLVRVVILRVFWAVRCDSQRHWHRRGHPVQVVIADDERVRVARFARHRDVALRHPSIAQGLAGLDKRLALGIWRGRSVTPGEEEDEPAPHDVPRFIVPPTSTTFLKIM